MWSPRNQNSAGALARHIGTGSRWVLRAALLLLFLAPAYTQNRGQADLAVQGFYLGGNSQPFLDTTGVAVHFQNFTPGIGFLSGSLEAYGAENHFQTGENFLELRGFPLVGQALDRHGRRLPHLREPGGVPVLQHL